MAAEGLHQPIGVRGPLADDAYEVVWGHRRLLAAQLLRWPSIEAKVFPASYDPLLAAVSENLQRADLSPLDEARAVALFVERGEPDAAIARLFRRSLSWVRGRRDLLTLPADLQEAVHAGQLAAAVARPLADVDHAPYRAQLVEEAIRVGATANTVEVWRAHYLADRERIVHNALAVEEIAARREAWVIYVPCDLCGEPHPYPDTRTLRACHPCLDAVLALVEAEARKVAP